MESQTSKQYSEYLSLAMWAVKLGLTEEELIEIAQNPLQPSFDEKDEIIYEGALEYSNSHAISFYLCCSHALDLYLKENITKQDVKEHLSKKLDQISKCFARKRLPRNCQTILLLGRTGEGKSLLTNHLVEREVARVGKGSKSMTLDAEPYISEKHELNIVDTEGLDGTSQKISNQELMEKLLMKIVSCFELGVSIEAIIIMWCPIKNGRSGLEKTIELVKDTFGDEALKSCIFMIQGDWKAAAKICDLGEAVPEEKEDLKKFPDIPLIEYDAKGSVEDQFPRLKAAIDKVQPYRKEYFEKKRKEEFFNMARMFKAKVQREVARPHSNETEEETERRLVLYMQASVIQSINNRESLLDKLKSIWNRVFTKENGELLLRVAGTMAFVTLVLMAAMKGR